MIFLYSGTPGSGKSLHVLKDIVFKLRKGGNVICNFPVKTDLIRSKGKPLGQFVFKENDELSVSFLIDYALKNHVKGVEAQTLIVIDEAQSLFNPREYVRKDRKDYNYFFSLHRKLGYNIILVTQNDRLLDRQIRVQLEYEVKHRKVNNFKTIGMLLPFKTFACINMWYGVRERLGTEFFIYTKKLGSYYDSYALFDLMKIQERFNVSSSEGVKEGVEDVKEDSKPLNSGILSRLYIKFSRVKD